MQCKLAFFQKIFILIFLSTKNIIVIFKILIDKSYKLYSLASLLKLSSEFSIRFLSTQ